MSENLSAPAVVQQIPVDQIAPSRHQARKDFDEEGIQQLAASIEKEDLLQPITVRKVGEGYELIAGERRLRAVKILGRPTIQAMVIEVASEAAACAKGLVENLQRKDLNPIEEAEGFQELNRLDPAYWTHDEIAKVAGHSRVYVTQSLGFSGLAPKVKDYVSRLTLTRSHALELMRLDPEKQEETADKVVKGDLSRENTRKLVDQLIKPKGEAAKESQGEKPASSISFSRSKTEIRFSGKVSLTSDMESVVDQFRQALVAWNSTLAAKPRQAGGKVTSTARLPANDVEKAELEALAASSSGPGPVYAWIFGSDSNLAKMVSGKSWEDLQLKDGAEGLPKILEGVIQYQKEI